MALMSHQVADITWHSMYLEQGFLPTMGYVSYLTYSTYCTYTEMISVVKLNLIVWRIYNVTVLRSIVFGLCPIRLKHFSVCQN